MNGTRSDPRPSRGAERAAVRFRNDLLASLDGLERGLETLRRRTLIVGLSAVAVVAADLVLILAARP